MTRRPPGQPRPRATFPFMISRRSVSVWCIVIAAGTLAGCSSPLALQTERDLRRSTIDTVRRELAEAERRPARVETRRESGIDRLQIDPRLMPDLERMAGPLSYDRAASPAMGEDLLGQPQEAVTISMERAIRTAVQNNLALQFARLQPAIAEAQLVTAQAAFDAVLFSNVDVSSIDSPRSRQTQNNVPSGPALDERSTVATTTGIRRPLPSGGQFIFQQDYNYSDINTPGFSQIPNPNNDLAYTIRFEQPLLRGFGSDVGLASVRLARNAERDAIASLKRDLIRTVTDTERAYWTVVQAQAELAILQRLYERGITVRDQVLAREGIDATPAQKADARARVERRRADVVRGQNALRLASDALKVLMNDPDLPVGGEALLLPADQAVDAPVSFSLIDVLATAVRARPELTQAILSIDNTSIRQLVADNARLPRLDLILQSRFAGLNDNFSDAFDQATDGEFIDYLAGIRFEQPLGNRAAESEFRRRREERKQATLAYRNAVQQVLQECKRALRNVVTSYQLIEQTRVSRLAETENLRSFEVEKRLIRGYDVNSLDLEFRRQEALAQSEREEIGALVDYQNAIAQLYQAMGTALERNRIGFEVPVASQPLDEGGLAQPRNPVTPVGGEVPRLSPPLPAGPQRPPNR